MWNIRKIVKKGDYLYAVVPEHPRAIEYGYVLHHRVVMENHLNRLLDATEVVHHLNGDKHDNRVENLQVMSAVEHATWHTTQRGRKLVRLQCPQCGLIFIRRTGQTHLTGSRGSSYTACSRSCSGKIARAYQLGRETHELDAAVSGNVLEIFMENPEQTVTTGCVETIRSAPETVKR